VGRESSSSERDKGFAVVGLYQDFYGSNQHFQTW
jgi:hypothetical protein